jgi:glucokinase
MVAIGFDVGGTRIKAVVAENDGAVLDQILRPTQPDTWLDQVTGLCQELLPAYGPRIEIGLCAPGIADQSGEAIWDCGRKIPGLEGLNWSRHFGWGRLVPVMNDAQAALLGESWLGAAAGRTHVALFTLGTGVGGAAIVDGQLLHGRFGRAGHFGHISIYPNDEQSVLNAPGSLENAVANLTLQKRSSGKFSDTLHLLEAVDDGNEFAVQIWRQTVSDLARGIVSVINVVDPELVLIGGGFASAGERIVRELRPYLDRWEWRPGGVGVELKLAELGEWAGAFGAARQAMREYFSSV